MKGFPVLLITLLLLSFYGKAQQTNIRLIPQQSYFVSIWDDSKALVSSPAKWDKKDWLTAGTVTATGLALYFVDSDIQKFSQRQVTPLSRDINKYILEPSGRGIFPAAIIGSFYLYGLIKKDERAYNFALNTGKAALINGVATIAIKHLTHRQRPHQGPEPNHQVWNGPFTAFENQSFFSGHTVTIWTFATAIATEYKSYKWIPWASYSLATLASLSRIHDNKHWASDVFIGAAFAYFSTKFIFNRNHKLLSNIKPTFNLNHHTLCYGITVSF